MVLFSAFCLIVLYEGHPRSLANSIIILSILELGNSNNTLTGEGKGEESCIHVISPDFSGSSRFGAFPPGLTLGRRNLPTRGFSNVIFLGPYFCPNILSFKAGSTWRIICL